MHIQIQTSSPLSFWTSKGQNSSCASTAATLVGSRPKRMLMRMMAFASLETYLLVAALFCISSLSASPTGSWLSATIIPISHMRARSRFFGKALVPMSPVFHVVGIWTSKTSLSLIFDWTHKTFPLRWRIFPQPCLLNSSNTYECKWHRAWSWLWSSARFRKKKVQWFAGFSKFPTRNIHWESEVRSSLICGVRGLTSNPRHKRFRSPNISP